MGWLGDFWDDVTGETDDRRRRYKRQTRVDAANKRAELVMAAYKIWLLRNNNAKSTLIDEASHINSLCLALQQFNHTNQEMEPALLSDSVQAEFRKFTRDKFFSTALCMDEIKQYAESEFYYDNGIFYNGVDDDFLKHLDYFMRSEIRHVKSLLNRWEALLKTAMEVHI